MQMQLLVLQPEQELLLRPPLHAPAATRAQASAQARAMRALGKANRNCAHATQVQRALPHPMVELVVRAVGRLPLHGSEPNVRAAENVAAVSVPQSEAAIAAARAAALARRSDQVLKVVEIRVKQPPYGRQLPRLVRALLSRAPQKRLM